MRYTNKFINLISLILSIIIFSIIYFLFFHKNISIDKIQNLVSEISIIKDSEDNKQIINEKDNENEKQSNGEVQQDNLDLGDWYIEIPVINLKAPIAEGIDANTLNTKVGHFPDTAMDYGNIGLAAHNRGYEFNYFENLKKLKNDDQIIYNYKGLIRTYNVNKIEIIENSNWEFLKKSDENKITLITCVENEPNYRRCVQAIEQ